MPFMIKTLPIILFVSSCAQFTFNDYTNIASAVFSDAEDVAISSEYIELKGYSFAKVKIGGSPPAILSLAYIKDDLFTWVSASGQKLITKHGKIIETFGLEHDLKLLNSIAHTFPIKKSHQLVQLSHPMAIVSQEIDSLQTVNETIVLDKNYSTELYVETFTTTPIKWSEKNYYWVDKDSKRVIRSHQHVHPYEDVIEIEFYYIYK
jgi:hypothetical protein